jgi:UTP--glucose-1-phosphate uridylyltransferase
VRDGLTFLDMTVRQVEFLNRKYGVDVPLLLMNSFNTHEETERLTAMYQHHNLNIKSFEQHCFPKISKKTLRPLPEGAFTEQTRNLWYPPGHGDVYSALADSGVLEELVNQVCCR